MEGVLLQSAEALGDAAVLAGAGEMWERLQAEKEEVERDILSDGSLLHEAAADIQEHEPSGESDGELEWRRREILEERLRLLNDAQDRLIDGAYGRCLECREAINAKRLAADPAAAFCIRCQMLAETESSRLSSRPRT